MMRLNLDLNEEGNYVHFLDNTQVSHHESIIYGIRELNEIEMDYFCTNKTIDQRGNVPKFHHPLYFTTDYQLRIYQSGCFYLDSNYQWQSGGLIVSSIHSFRTINTIIYISGGSVNKSLSNTMFFNTFNDIYWCMAISFHFQQFQYILNELIESSSKQSRTLFLRIKLR